MLTQLKLIILSIVICLSGCGLYDFQTIETTQTTEVIISDVDKNIVESLNTATREDCIKMYKFFAGIALYIDHSSNLQTTPQVFALIDKVEKDYLWEKEIYKDLTNIIEKDLINKNFAEPKKIDSNIKQQLITVFEGYAELCKKAAKSK